MAGFEKTAKTPRAGRFPSPRHGPGRRSRLDLLTALDAARHLLAHSEALDAVDARSTTSPETDARASTTWRL